MGHWEQIGVENRKWRERRAKWPRWRLELYRYTNAAPIIAGWLALLAIGLWAFSPL
jgi:hypothetical protein